MTEQPPADRADLRDRIAAALYDHTHPGWAIGYTDLTRDERDTYLRRADAVLAVLPEPSAELRQAQAEAHQYRTALQGVARQNAVLPEPADRAAIERVRALADAIDVEMRIEPDTQRAAMQMEAVTRIRAALHGHEPRRMADEEQPAEAPTARCPSCDHKREFHDADGRCWFTVDHGVPESNLVCPCAPRRDHDEEQQPAAADTNEAQPAADSWHGATELVPDREVQRLAATGLVGYQQDRGRLLHCLHHKPAPASRYVDFQEVTAEDLPDGGICVHPSCGADLLAAQPSAEARQDGAQP